MCVTAHVFRYGYTCVCVYLGFIFCRFWQTAKVYLLIDLFSNFGCLLFDNISTLVDYLKLNCVLQQFYSCHNTYMVGGFVADQMYFNLETAQYLW